MFKIQINTDNACFDDYLIIGQIRCILDRISLYLGDGKTEGIIYDFNGNKIGNWFLEKEEDE